MRISAVGVVVAALILGACVSSESWKRKKLYESHVTAGDAHLDNNDAPRALAHYNAAIKKGKRSADASMGKRRTQAAAQVAATQLQLARAAAPGDGVTAIRIIAALRGSGSLGVAVDRATLDALSEQAAQTAWREIGGLASARRYYPALVKARIVAAAMPPGHWTEQRLTALGAQAAQHHRGLAVQGARLVAPRLFHQGLALLMSRPTHELRTNAHETTRDRPNRTVRVRGGGPGCAPFLDAIEDELRRTTTQIIQVQFAFGGCPTQGVRKRRQQQYTYYAKIPYRKKVTGYESEVSGKMGAQSSKCVSTRNGRCTNYATTTTGGGNTYRLVKKKVWVTKYRTEKRVGTRMVSYTEHRARAAGTASLSVAKQASGRVVVQGFATSNETRAIAIELAAKQIAQRVAAASLGVAQGLANRLVSQGNSTSDPLAREQSFLLALAVTGTGSNPYLQQRYGVDGAIVRDLLGKRVRWPPIGLPAAVGLPEPERTTVEMDIAAGRLRTPASLDEGTGEHIRFAFSARNSYLRDVSRLHALEVGMKNGEATTWASLGLKALGGDGSSFDLQTQVRFRGEHFGALVGAYLGLEIGDTPEDEMLNRSVFVGLGPTFGGQASWWRFSATALLMPNVLQIFGSGDLDGTSRPTPALANAEVRLPFGFYAFVGGTVYLGVPDDGIWNLGAGWRLGL